MKRLGIIFLLIFTLSTFVTPLPALAASSNTVKIVKLTSPIKHGKKAKLIVQALKPGDQCNLAYRTPSGTNSKAKGLGAKTADKKGQCIWTWEIGSNTKPGTGQLTIKASGVTLRKPIIIK